MPNHLGVACALAVALAPGLAAADVITDELGALKIAAKCADPASPWRPWCIATDYPTGTADLPTGKTLVGMTIELQKGKEAAALSSGVTFVALAVSSDGKAKLTDVKPTSPSEETMTLEAVGYATLVFKGKATTAKMPADLVGYVKTLTGTYAATKADGAYTWAGASPTSLRKVGAFWVAIEVPKSGGGIWATILTDAWQ